MTSQAILAEDPTFTYPAESAYQALHGAVKTRKQADGFQAVAAFWFMGKRQNLQYFTAATRSAARSAGYRWLHQ